VANIEKMISTIETPMLSELIQVLAKASPPEVTNAGMSK
jgi:hypothetical protein